MCDISYVCEDRLTTLACVNARCQEFSQFVEGGICFCNCKVTLALCIEEVFFANNVRTYRNFFFTFCLQERNDFGSKLFRTDHISFCYDNFATLTKRSIDHTSHKFVCIHRNRVTHFVVWCLEESVFIHTRVCGEVNHKTDVWTFWSSDRTDTTVVTWVHVTHIEARAFSRKTTRTHRRETTLMSEF